MDKWNMNDLAAQENQPLTSDDRVDWENSLPRRERGQTFLENNNSERQNLVQNLTRLFGAFQTNKKVPNEVVNEAQENGCAAHTLNAIDSTPEPTNEAESAASKTPTRAPNRKGHARKHTMAQIDYHLIPEPFSLGESPPEVKRDQGQVQSGSQHKSSPGKSDMSGTFAYPSKSFKS